MHMHMYMYMRMHMNMHIHMHTQTPVESHLGPLQVFGVLVRMDAQRQLPEHALNRSVRGPRVEQLALQTS